MKRRYLKILRMLLLIAVVVVVIVANVSHRNSVIKDVVVVVDYVGNDTLVSANQLKAEIMNKHRDITTQSVGETNLEDINADRDIIATYVDEGDFTSALSLADMLPSLYGLTGTDLAEHQMYKDLLMLYRDWHISERNAMQMDSTEKAMVEHIADCGTGFPQIMAQA